MKSYTVAVIGLGPAGFAAAYELQRRKENYVVITDSYEKECTGLLPFRTVDWFKKKGLDDVIEESLLTPEELDLVIFIRKNNKILEDYRPRFVLNVDRIHPFYRFNKQLYDLIQNKVNNKVINIRKDKDSFEIILNNGKKIRAENVIWATGYRNDMIKREAYQFYYENAGIKTAYFIILENMDFYIWIVPKGKYLIVGALKEHLEKIPTAITMLKERENVILGYPIYKKIGKIFLPRDLKGIKLKHNGMILVGESAGLVSRNYGEGIYPALISGELAGKYFDDIDKYVSEAKKYVVRFIAERFIKAKKLYHA